MRESNSFLTLRQRAETILNTRKQNKKIISYNEVYELIDKINLYQIELELLTEELHNNALELEESRQRYADLYNFIPFSYFAFNQHGTILEVNDAGADLLGVKKDQLINRNIARYIAPACLHLFTDYCKNILTTSSFQTCEIQLLRKDGPLFHAEFKSKVVQNLLTGEKNIITFVSGISDHRRNEEALYLQHNKMAITERNTSMGELASVLSHELNHPLSVINNFLHGCIRRLEVGNFNVEEITHALKQAADQSYRIAEVVLRMKNFSCNGCLHFESADINSLIQEAISFINYETYDFPIHIQYHPVKNFPAISIDKIHIQQVIINLARNAIEAMRDANGSQPKLMIEANQTSTSEIEICIIDNGPGITSDNEHQLFNPYFTTKPYGIGLGLAVCHTIIKAHHGKLVVEPNPFGGTCFKFTLPILKD